MRRVTSALILDSSAGEGGAGEGEGGGVSKEEEEAHTRGRLCGRDGDGDGDGDVRWRWWVWRGKGKGHAKVGMRNTCCMVLMYSRHGRGDGSMGLDVNSRVMELENECNVGMRWGCAVFEGWK